MSDLLTLASRIHAGATGQVWLYEGHVDKADMDAFVQGVFCDNSCGHCHSCQLLEHGQHPDYISIVPEDHAIKIDTVRKLIETVCKRPTTDRRLVVINPIDMLNHASSHALLKTFEESRQTWYLLITTNSSLLLPTIRSRAQICRSHNAKTTYGVNLSKWHESLQMKPEARVEYWQKEGWSWQEVTEMLCNWLLIQVKKNPSEDYFHLFDTVVHWKSLALSKKNLSSELSLERLAYQLQKVNQIS